MADNDGKLPELVTSVICQALINAAPVIGACLADYEAEGVTPGEVMAEFVGGRAAFVITVAGAGIIPAIDRETYERVRAAATN